MKIIFFIFALVLNINLFAHEGHGEMPTEPAKYGGVLANVVSQKKMEAKEKNNAPLMKSEIVKSEDGTVRLYLYDLKMNEIKLDKVSAEAKGEVENKKVKQEQKFILKAQGDHFIGKLPPQKKKPYNVYITFSKGEEKFFVGFDNLD